MYSKYVRILFIAAFGSQSNYMYVHVHVHVRAVASGPVGPVLAGPTFGAGGCGKRKSAHARRVRTAPVRSLAAIDRSFIPCIKDGCGHVYMQSHPLPGLTN